MSRFFIERPIFANVIAYLTIIIGLVALGRLPVSQYPDITPPTVQVTARMAGASAQTIADTVALPIEQQVNGVENMLYMQSTSADDGSYKLTITFKVGTDLDFAQVLVQNRVAAAVPKLPPEIQVQGVVTKKVSTAILLVINLTSPDNRYDSLYLSNYAYINMRDEILRIPGVGDANIFGFGEYAMRIWLNPDTLKAYNLTPTEVINAINQQNIQVPAGQIGSPPSPATQEFQYTINVRGRLDKLEDFENITVKVIGNRILRIKDVGRVDLGAQTYSIFCHLDNKPSAGIAIYQLPGANALDVAQSVKDAVARMSKNFPPGLEYTTALDTTLFTRASINEVYRTLFEAAILVLIVILVFLQDWRAVLVPATTVPVTIVGAFIAMAGLGFSVNMVTLFALILAIGIVVDDAIVIVEGAAHGIEKGLNPKEAAIQAMKELTGPVIGITLVLMAVFIPAAFLPGITGQLYNQFALVIAATAAISALNAMTLKPVQCSQYLRPHKGELNVFFRGFNVVYQKFEDGYVALIDWAVHHSHSMMVVFAILMAATVWGFLATPTGFLPEEDQGYAIVAIQLPSGASLARTETVMKKVSEAVNSVPGIAHTIAIGGVSVLDNSATLPNGGVIYATYQDFSVRGKTGQTQEKIVTEIRKKVAPIQDGVVVPLIPPAIQGLGVANGFQMQLQSRSGFNYQQLASSVLELGKAAQQSGGVTSLASSFRAGTPQINAAVDRVKAEMMGVAVGDVFKTLQAYMGSYFVNQFTMFGRPYQVYVQADAPFRLEPEDIRKLNVRNIAGDMVSLGSVTDVSLQPGPSIISLYNLFPTAALNGSAAEGFSSGEALKAMEEAAARVLPRDVSFEWTGMSYQEKLVGNQAMFVFAFSTLLVFMVLAAQYESWTNPAAVILCVPLALLGTIIALAIRGYDNNVYTQIGLVLLIALASKNAILIVEVARELRAAGMPILKAASEASRRRLRPILMTSFAFILGVMPLVVAEGAGSASRRALGTAVFGGMLASTFLAVFFVPVFWTVMQSFSEWKAGKNADAPKETPVVAPHE